MGAGRDERAVAGSRWSSTVAWPGSRAGALKVVDGPRGRWHRPRAAPRTSRRPSPGRHTLQLDGRDVSDTVEVDAGYGPLVPIDTQASRPDHERARDPVGGNHYTPVNLAGTQVLVLDRRRSQAYEDNTWMTVAQITQDLGEQNDASS